MQSVCGRAQQVSVEMRHAAVEFHSEHYLKLTGQQAADPADAAHVVADRLAMAHVGRGQRLAFDLDAPPRLHHRLGLALSLGVVRSLNASSHSIGAVGTSIVQRFVAPYAHVFVPLPPIPAKQLYHPFAALGVKPSPRQHQARC